MLKAARQLQYHFDIEPTDSSVLGPNSRIQRFHHTELAQHIEAHEIWPNDRRDAHARILESYQKRYPGLAWWEMPNDGYLFENLAYHLNKSGRCKELRSLLLDYSWLRAKIEATDVHALLIDFSWLPASPNATDVRSAISGSLFVRDDPEAAQVLTALRQSVPALTIDRSHLAAQILSRLPRGQTPAITALVRAAERSIGPSLDFRQR